MTFKNPQHKRFFFEMLETTKKNDSYGRAFFYIAGLSEDTRKHIGDIFDFEENCIEPDGLSKGWQTSGSRKITLMAFNLWNGYVEPDCEEECTPNELFSTPDAMCFMEEIKQRFPEFVREPEQKGKEFMR